MQADMRVLRPAAEEIWIDTEPEALAAARRHLEMYTIGREVEVDDVSEERAILSLIGPAQRRGRRHSRRCPSTPAKRPPSPASSASRSAPRVGIDLIAAAAEAERLRDALLAAGAVEVDPAAAEILRIEAGTPRFGAEMGTATMPAEAGIVEAAVSFTKGCYIGQETVARLHYKGRPNRHLRGLRLSAPAEPGAALRLGEKEVGRLGGSLRLPRPRTDRAGDPAARGRARRRARRR